MRTRNQNLRTAIQAEAGNFISLLNNKVKLFALMASDTCVGKMNQQLKEPKIIEIKNDNPSQFFGQVAKQAETPMPSGGTLPGDQVCPETIDNISGGTQRLGQEPDDSGCVAEPESIEMDL